MSTERNQRLGRYVRTRSGAEEVRAYLPPPLPPFPPIQLDGLQVLLEQANQALGRLDGLAQVLPNVNLFLYAYVRKEAVLSSQIEGTQSSFSDLVMFETNQSPGVPLGDVQEVSDYVAALEYGLHRMRNDLPLSLRLIREIHGVLLSGGRGSEKEPGEFRRSQNWIGGTRPGNALYVPPPPAEVMDCMAALERFLHEERPDLPVLIKAGLVHVQFESIHPFLDGNGRLGRLLVTFLLCASGALQEPILYLSLYLKQHRTAYYELLTRVRTEGAWEQWLEFFLLGVKQTADQAVAAARRLLDLIERDRKAVEKANLPPSVLRVFHWLQERPIVNASLAAEELGLSFPTASSALEHLRSLQIVQEITGRERNRLYSYQAYVAILNEGTEPLP